MNFSVAQVKIKAFGSSIQIAQEIHGFRWVEERDLTGFIDGTENPQDEQRSLVGIKMAPIKTWSYVFTQRYEHNLAKWKN